MSIYPRENSPFLWTEFQIDGVRFRLSTEETDRRKAQTAERRLKIEKKAELAKAQARKAEWGGKEPPTIGYAAARFYQEIGQFHADPDETWIQLEWLTDYFKQDTLLPEIDADKISEMIAKRRGIRIHRDTETAKIIETPSDSVTNATVNRSAIEPLRKLFRRARDVWQYPIPYPEWKKLLLSEPKPGDVGRESTPEEDRAIIAALGPDYGRLYRFMIAQGMRVGGALLAWPQIDKVNRTARTRNKASDGQERWYTVPLSNAAYAILQECEGHHEMSVFTYEARRTIHSKGPGMRREKGQRYPITDSGFKSEWARAVKATGIAPGLRRHDTRHTTGTRYLRKTRNLKATQQLLGHSKIETTIRYAHVLVEDVRAGLEEMEADNRTNAESAVGENVGTLNAERGR